MHAVVWTSIRLFQTRTRSPTVACASCNDTFSVCPTNFEVFTKRTNETVLACVADAVVFALICGRLLYSELA